MSNFISLRILASLGLGKKRRSLGKTPVAPPVGDGAREPPTREEPTSASRISVSRVRIED